MTAPTKTFRPGISLKNMNPINADTKNSTYLKGASADRSVASNARKIKYCIRFAKDPNNNSSDASNNVGVFQTKSARGKVRMLVTMAKYSSMVILSSLSSIFFTITSCTANMNADATGIIYANLNEKEDSLLYKVINAKPKKPISVAIHLVQLTRSLRKNIDKTSTNSGIVHIIATISTSFIWTNE
ncbi:hypothetical protein FACS189449_06910 [Alphaproteobacteria bacterium]|nr:hypothetical protein FACS189449_06910 [Alphaproteobacteria bacterium]